MKEVRLGTIGTGAIVHSVLDGVAVVDGIRLAAVYSRSREKGEALARQYGAQRVYTDMEAFLRDDGVNFVYIASPNLLHYEQAKRALLAGKHVICEKPFCTRAGQARELVAIAKEKGRLLIDAVPPAFLPNLEIVKRELPRIGKVRLVQGNYSQYSSRYDLFLRGELPNVFNPEYGGGCLMDINFYNIYLNVLLFGKPRSVVYYPNMLRGIDTSGIAVMQYDGFVSELVGAKDTWGVNFFQIEGEKGYIYIEGGSNGLTGIRVVTKASEERFDEQGDQDRWLLEVRKLTELVLNEEHDPIERGLKVMLDVMEVLETMRTAAGIRFPGD